jgi:spore germination protein GerM
MRTICRLRRTFAIAVTLALVAGIGGCTRDPEVTPVRHEPDATTHQVEVFFTNLERGEIGQVFPVTREITDEDHVRGALTQLLAGPTAQERAQGYSSWFSAATADLLLAVRVSDGEAVVDLDLRLPRVIPNASTSAGSTALLAELDATLLQFPEVTATRYRLDGDEAAFAEWLQLAPQGGDPATTGGTPQDATDDATGDAPAAVEPGSNGAPARVEVFFTNLALGPDDEVFPVRRTVQPPAVLVGALEQLLRGPTAAERDAGYSSLFSADTVGLLDSVRIEDGTAYVHFDARLPSTIPNASSSAGSTALLAALDATVTQFPTVDTAVYSLEGDVAAFYGWLQRDAPPA